MFIRGAMLLAGALAAPRTMHATAAALTPDTLRVVLIVDDTSARRSLVRGATLGAEEAARTGAMFGTPVSLRILMRAGYERMGRAALSHSPRVTPPSLYIVAADSLLCSEVARQGAGDSTPVLDVGCPASPWATDVDRATVYTIDSRANASLPAGAPVSGAADSSRLELWVASLEKFGGEQLNHRFRRRFTASMDSDAWAGWFAMKIALDLALHAHASSGAALLTRIADPATSFDGQKGRPLRFSANDHRLVQPLYRVTGSGSDAHVVEELIQ